MTSEHPIWDTTAPLPQQTVLAKYVQEGLPAIQDLTKQAEELLAQSTGDPSFDAYVSANLTRVREQVRALYETIRRLPLSFRIEPQGSVLPPRQEIRLAETVLATTHQHGCCIDLVLLLAGVLKNVGLYPLIVVVEDLSDPNDAKKHAVLGYWTKPLSVAMGRRDQPNRCLPKPVLTWSDLRRHAGRTEFLDCTGLVCAPSLDFATALADALTWLPPHPGREVKYAVDVQACRALGVEPFLLRPRPDWRPPLPGVRIGGAALPLHATDKLYGRDADLRRLDSASADPNVHLLTIVAFGGVGKTSLVAQWIARQSAEGWRGFEWVFTWSFYSRGGGYTGRKASAATFLADALEFFGGGEGKALAKNMAGPSEKGALLADYVGNRRSLLVLDGLEPLQDPITGELDDPALKSLLLGLAHRNVGLCLITTREPVKDLMGFSGTTALKWDLQDLPESAGVELLESLEVHGPPEEMQSLVRDAQGHALTLNLMGRYLAGAHGGDVRRRTEVDFEGADRVQGGHAFRVIEAYEKWLQKGGLEGRREVALLRLLGLFAHPPDLQCLSELLRPPVIGRLTEPLAGLAPEQLSWTFNLLFDHGLLLGTRPSVTIPDSPLHAMPPAACHPLIREYFAREVRKRNPTGWRSAHERLFEHFCERAPAHPASVGEMQPLFDAFEHGCEAGKIKQVFKEIYRKRIVQDKKDYLSNELGVPNKERELLRRLFSERELPRVLSEEQLGFLYRQQGLTQRKFGEIDPALKSLIQAFSFYVLADEPDRVVNVCRHLSQMFLLLGRIRTAVTWARFGDLNASDNRVSQTERVALAAALAHALDLQGEAAEAREWYKRAYAGGADLGRQWLAWLQGFRHCDFLLIEIEREAWRRTMSPIEAPQDLGSPSPGLDRLDEVEDMAKQTLHLAEHSGPSRTPLDIALNHLTLGRVALYRTLVTTPPDDRRIHSDHTHEHLETAEKGLRAAGQKGFLPYGLLSLAWLRTLDGRLDGAFGLLDEAWRIAQLGSMRLRLADIHLYRARLFCHADPYPWESPRADLAAARQIIEACGYGRRREELDDAEGVVFFKGER